ncbi:MAG: hypothetical protein ACOZBZ_03240 [Patescibacteria group bacterium]
MSEIKDEEKIQAEEISIPEIVERRIIPIIDRYEEILAEDIKSIAPDYRLGEISQEDLDRNLGYLDSLKNLLGEFIKGPEKFKVVAKSESHENGDRYSLKLKRPTDPEKLPTEKSKAVTELSFYVVLQEPFETREERLAAEALGKPPERAVLQMEKKAPREISVTMSTVSVYFDEEIGKPRVNFHSGVVLSSSSQEGMFSQGVVYIGTTPHYTCPLPEKAVSREECTALRDYVTNFFERK